MENLWWFYAIGLVILIIPNAIAVGKGRKISSNIFQIICYFVVMWVFLFLDNTTGVNEKFFFISGLIFLVTFGLELWQFARNEERSFWDSIFLILSIAPIVCSMGFLSGMFI